MHLYKYVHVYSMYVYIVCIYRDIYIYMNIYAYLYAYVYVYMYICICIHVYICTYTYTYTNIYIYINICSCILFYFADPFWHIQAGVKCVKTKKEFFKKKRICRHMRLGMRLGVLSQKFLRVGERKNQPRILRKGSSRLWC